MLRYSNFGLLIPGRVRRSSSFCGLSNRSTNFCNPIRGHFLDIIELLKILVDGFILSAYIAGMEAYSDYQRVAYDAARLELNELLTEQERLQKRIVSVRQFIQSVASLFETQGIDLNASIEAAELLRNSTLADEIRIILRSAYPGWLRPGVVKNDLIRLGHNLKKYKNPQATIQMVLKRMAESNDVHETALPEDGKKVYRCVPQVPSLSDPENPLYKSGMRPFPAHSGIGAVTNALGPGQSELRMPHKMSAAHEHRTDRDA